MPSMGLERHYGVQVLIKKTLKSLADNVVAHRCFAIPTLCAKLVSSAFLCIAKVSVITVITVITVISNYIVS